MREGVKEVAAEVLSAWGEEPSGITRAFREGGNEYRLEESELAMM